MPDNDTPEIITQLMGAFLVGGQLAVAEDGLELLPGLGVMLRRRSSGQIRSMLRGMIRIADEDDPEHFAARLEQHIGGTSERLGPEWLIWFVAGVGAMEVAEGLASLYRQLDPPSYPVSHEMKTASRKRGKERLGQLELFIQLRNIDLMPTETTTRIIRKIHTYNSVERDAGVHAMGSELEMKLRQLLG